MIFLTAKLANLIKNTSVGIDLAFWGNHGYNKQYFLSSKRYSYNTVAAETTYDKDGNATVTEKTNYAESASQEMNRGFQYQIENVLSYEKSFGKHAVSVILGQSAISSTSANVGASARGLMYPYDPYKISVNNTLGQQADGDRNGWGSWNSIPYRLASYFGRVSYNYDERYMAEVTFRRDGSSRFGSNNKWGNFPSVSLGWNIKNEAFMQNVEWLSALKLRGSWGINGNDAIGNFVYAVYMNSGNNYVFGSGGNGSESITLGSKPSGLATPDARWEASRQTNIGVDASFLNNRLTFTADWYNKKTAGMLLSMPVPGYAGDSAPTGNLGDMVNKGFEFEIGWRDVVGDFKYHVSVNATYNKNELTYLGDDSTHLYGSSHKIGQLTRGSIGLPFPYFFGYKTDGIFQNMDEVNAHVNADGQLLQPKAAPGDVRFKDLDGNGTLEDLDKLEELAYYIKENSLCGLGQTAPNPVLATLKFFRDEYEAHVIEKRCPAGVCKKLLSYSIVEDLCKGCTACARKCPVGAISGAVKQAHTIDNEKCIKCGVCMDTCKFNAIIKK